MVRDSGDATGLTGDLRSTAEDSERLGACHARLVENTAITLLQITDPGAYLQRLQLRLGPMLHAPHSPG